jgi:beta-glucanase (GH16 family)
VFDVGGTGGGNNELEYYSDGTNNAALDGDGHLVITARRETHGNNDYTSARIKTLGKASWTFGRVEARIKIPKGQGIWPAFWMLGSSCTGYPVSGWPDCGEIDVMENIGKAADQNLVHGTLHGPGYSAAAGPTQTVTLTSPVSADYHVFAIEWQKDRIDWYVDSSLYSTKTPDDIPSTAKWVYNAPFYVLLNVAVGGDWPGAPDGTTVFPQEMIVDYVRVCQKP